MFNVDPSRRDSDRTNLTPLMKRKQACRRAAILAAPCLLALGILGIGCVNEPPPFDPKAMQKAERERAQTDAAPLPMRPLPTTLESNYLPPRGGASTAPNGVPQRRPATAPATGPSLDVSRIVRMPLQEIIHRAAVNNTDVKVAGFNPGIEATREVEAEARFDPSFFAGYNFQRNNQDTISSASGFGGRTIFRDRSQVHSLQGGIRQQLESGGSVSLQYQTSQNYFRGSSFNPNPFQQNQLIFDIRQPLLQNFGSDVNRARITIARNNQRISLLDFRKQIEETTSDIERTYWQLIQAERDVKVNEQLLGETMRTADILLKRLGQDVTRVQISQANASVESRRATLIRAQSRVYDLSDQLKRLMNDPDMPVTSGALILPADHPLEEPVRFNLGDEINTAMHNRFELGQQQYRIDSSDVARRFAKNQLLPSLDFVGQVNVNGLDDNLGGAFEQQADFGTINYSLGLQLDIPIGNRAARAQYRRAEFQRQQAIVQYQGLIDQVSLDVKVALREVETSWNEAVATRQAVFAARDSLDAIEQRERGGEALTPTFVQLKLQQQEQLADAARRENEATANYNIALSRLELAKGTLLKYNNVIMEEDKLEAMAK